jgi:hypothetical protein
MQMVWNIAGEELSLLMMPLSDDDRRRLIQVIVHKTGLQMHEILLMMSLTSHAQH